jgi:hypothetical protein
MKDSQRIPIIKMRIETDMAIPIVHVVHANGQLDMLTIIATVMIGIEMFIRVHGKAVTE